MFFHDDDDDDDDDDVDRTETTVICRRSTLQIPQYSDHAPAMTSNI